MASSQHGDDVRSSTKKAHSTAQQAGDTRSNVTRTSRAPLACTMHEENRGGYVVTSLHCHVADGVLTAVPVDPTHAKKKNHVQKTNATLYCVLLPTKLESQIREHRSTSSPRRLRVSLVTIVQPHLSGVCMQSINIQHHPSPPLPNSVIHQRRPTSDMHSFALALCVLSHQCDC